MLTDTGYEMGAKAETEVPEDLKNAVRSANAFAFLNQLTDWSQRQSSTTLLIPGRFDGPGNCHCSLPLGPP